MLWLLVFSLGLATGYLLWGSRLGNLTEALNHIVLEDDALRQRLADSADRGELEGLVERVAAEVRLQGRLIEEQLDALDTASAQAEDRSSACEHNSAQLERWLDACLAQRQATVPLPAPPGSASGPPRAAERGPGADAQPQEPASSTP